MPIRPGLDLGQCSPQRVLGGPDVKVGTMQHLDARRGERSIGIEGGNVASGSPCQPQHERIGEQPAIRIQVAIEFEVSQAKHVELVGQRSLGAVDRLSLVGGDGCDRIQRELIRGDVIRVVGAEQLECVDPRAAVGTSPRCSRLRLGDDSCRTRHPGRGSGLVGRLTSSDWSGQGGEPEHCRPCDPCLHSGHERPCFSPAPAPACPGRPGHRDHVGGATASILAARMKSFSESPPIAWVWTSAQALR